MQRVTQYKLLLTIAILLVALIVFLIAHSLTHVTLKPSAVAIVDITSTGFSPKTIAVRPNTEIIWLNQDSNSHLPVADNASQNIGIPHALSFHQTYEYELTHAGRLDYYDSMNTQFTGTVIVK